MRKLAFYGILVFCLVVPFGASFGQESERIFKETFAPRLVESVCPPEYQAARDQLEWYLEGSHWSSGPDIKHLIKDFGLRELSISDFEVLRDEKDAHACERRNEQFSKLMDRRIQFFEGVEPEYLYDIAYYKAGGFYFVVVGGGILIQEDPLNPGTEVFHAGHAAGRVFVYDRDGNQVHSRQIREMIERGEIKPPDEK
jgi:hypothetical protein